MDWNNDGKKDIVTGERQGTVRIYLNTATDNAPAFNGYTILEVNGVSFDSGYNSFPFIVDWNNDGLKDVICGEDFGEVALLINSGTYAAPKFQTVDHIQSGGSPLDVGIDASPVVADWNSDGRKDLLIGCEDGKVYYFENVGSDAAPVFNGSAPLKTGPFALDVGAYSRPAVVDWDEDSVDDLLCGHHDFIGSPKSGVLFFHNIGPLTVNGTELSQSSGGTIEFSLDAGTINKNRDYFLLGSVSGKSPGTQLPGGAVIPLNYDPVFSFIRTHFNNTILQDFRGTLDYIGRGTARLVRPTPLPFAVGQILNFAYTTERPYDFQSNAVTVEITP